MTRISALTALTSADSGDTLPILDVSATTTKKITKTAFISDIVDGTLIAAQAITPLKVNLKVADATARTALSSPFEGLQVYQADTDYTYIYDGSAWRQQAQWEELGRTTLTGAGDTISLTPIVARKHLQIWYSATSTGGIINAAIRFNNDSAANYTYDYSANFGALTTVTGQTSMAGLAVASAGFHFGAFDVINVSASRKIVQGQGCNDANAGAGTGTNTVQLAGKWDNVAAQITRVDIINLGAGDFAIGSQLIVLGRD